jgi:predicted nucleotidyltransferase component of viral defense system
MNQAMRLKARMKQIAQEDHLSAQVVLQNFMLERLLERISLSQYKDKLILKGGMLIAAVVGLNSRATMDMDATLREYPLTEESILAAFSEICAIRLDDEVIFTQQNITSIRDDDEYGGYRVALHASFETIQTPLKVDITTGDRMTPGPVLYRFHSHFEDKTIEVWAYNLETILAEKVETIVRRGIFNTRPRDFYDVYIILKTQRAKITGDIYYAALDATAEKRQSSGALQQKKEVLRAIQSDLVMRQRWERYCRENVYANGIDFDDVIQVLQDLGE